jgi:hypothetical protein
MRASLLAMATTTTFFAALLPGAQNYTHRALFTWLCFILSQPTKVKLHLQSGGNNGE